MLRTPTRTETALAVCGLALSTAAALVVLKYGVLPDFLVMWAAQHTDRPYDFAALFSAMTAGFPATPPATHMVYGYPPTFLLLTAWLKLLPFRGAYLLWASLWGGALVAVTRRIAGPAVLFSPWVIFALMAGQTSVAMGALLFAALQLRERAIMSGVLLGIAACIKPQYAILFILGLTFAGQWRAVLACGATGAVLCLATIPAYGLGSWIAWFGNLHAMREADATIRAHLDLPSNWMKAAALAVGLPLIWRAFREGGATDQLLTAGLTGLLVCPHSLWYASAMVAPGMAAALSRPGLTRWPLAAALLFRPSPTLLAFALIAASAALLTRKSTVHEPVSRLRVRPQAA